MGLALGPSLRAVLRFTLGGQDEVRRGEPGHALVSHVPPLTAPAVCSLLSLPTSLWRRFGLSILPVVSDWCPGTWLGSSQAPIFVQAPFTCLARGRDWWVGAPRAPQPSLPQC